MTTSDRLKGNTGLLLTFKKGAAAAAPFGDDVKQWEVSSDDKDDSDLTFAEAAAGLGVDWTLKLTAIASTTAGSLWRYLWDNPGSDLAVILAPHGNTVPTATKPHLSFSINSGPKPGLSNEAKKDGKTGAEFEVELAGTSDVTLVTA